MLWEEVRSNFFLEMDDFELLSLLQTKVLLHLFDCWFGFSVDDGLAFVDLGHLEFLGHVVLPPTEGPRSLDLFLLFLKGDDVESGVAVELPHLVLELVLHFAEGQALNVVQIPASHLHLDLGLDAHRLGFLLLLRYNVHRHPLHEIF